ncbi:uncharacterized protein LOC141704875 [Apium graveolens]|uniref:uncharacterized protein LOC141704875 n=1 Tax=Apium graveolens TaxID=4045 RepID=UPI003D79EFB9
MEDLNIAEEENEELYFDDEVVGQANKFELCLVGRFLTEKNINVKAMKTKMANVWKPAMGINIKEIKFSLFLFQVYHKDDLTWVQKGGPWSFDGAILVLSGIALGEDPSKIPLTTVNFRIQIHDFPIGFMSESIYRELGNFLGIFIEYDPNNNRGIWRNHMRVRIQVGVRKPLKRRKKVAGDNSKSLNVNRPVDEELIGMDLEERKHRRFGSSCTDIMDANNSGLYPT